MTRFLKRRELTPPGCLRLRCVGGPFHGRICAMPFNERYAEFFIHPAASYALSNYVVGGLSGLSTVTPIKKFVYQRVTGAFWDEHTRSEFKIDYLRLCGLTHAEVCRNAFGVPVTPIRARKRRERKKKLG